jgi:hypothetical protein
MAVKMLLIQTNGGKTGEMVAEGGVGFIYDLRLFRRD